MTGPGAASPLLAIEDLSLSFGSASGRAMVLDGVKLAILPGQAVGLVGESGSGKSVTAMSVMRLLPAPPSRVEGGRILFRGEDLLRLSPGAMRAIRGDRIGMIFQEPMTSLNPTYTVGFQIAEALALHGKARGRAARDRAAFLLDRVGVGPAARRLHQFPHELSGGLRQRVMMAMALACDPDLLIADEPTTALDVTIQAQILDLIARLRAELGMSVLLITHDLGVVAEVCDLVAVMYAGRIVEQAPSAALFAAPRHPYTVGLMESAPKLGQRMKQLPTIPGMVPPPGQRGSGCGFAGRCRRALACCAAEPPPLLPVSPESGLNAALPHLAACWNPVP
ncbi:MAG TPA: ABC transporter ATP-binding protein [Acetobacteraceae bacterium]|nr:ABC transporter ATP-binding protein [Acetobacteraceae bacterium]